MSSPPSIVRWERLCSFRYSLYSAHACPSVTASGCWGAVRAAMSAAAWARASRTVIVSTGPSFFRQVFRWPRGRPIIELHSPRAGPRPHKDEQARLLGVPLDVAVNRGQGQRTDVDVREFTFWCLRCLHHFFLPGATSLMNPCFASQRRSARALDARYFAS